MKKAKQSPNFIWIVLAVALAGAGCLIIWLMLPVLLAPG